MNVMTTFMLKENETKVHHFSRPYEPEELKYKCRRQTFPINIQSKFGFYVLDNIFFPTPYRIDALDVMSPLCRALYHEGRCSTFFRLMILSLLHCTAIHCTALHCSVLHCTALHCTALHCTALHCTALHCTALHCTALHCTVKQNTKIYYCTHLAPKWFIKQHEEGNEDDW